MDFFLRAGAAAILIVLTVFIEGAGMAAVINWGIVHFTRDRRRLGPVRSTILVVRLSGVMIVLHILQILLWAVFYRCSSFATWNSAAYFSITSYSTVGYGDVLPPREWRLFGPVESVAGVLMSGLTASFLFAVVTRLVDRETLRSPEHGPENANAATRQNTPAFVVSDEQSSLAACSPQSSQ